MAKCTSEILHTVCRKSCICVMNKGTVEGEEIK